MPLPPPRDGETIDLYQYSFERKSTTLGEPEKVIWSSIKLLAAYDIVDGLLFSTHKVKSKKKRDAIAKNIRYYINHASDFYDAANQANVNAAPLLYYYAFLNLAKARCEIAAPMFHTMSENYRHGLSWKPSERSVADPKKESVIIVARGVWHALYEALTGRPPAVANPTKIKLSRLLALCPEIAVEYGDNFTKPRPFVELVEPVFLHDEKKKESWLRFSIAAENLKAIGVTRTYFLKAISPKGNFYKRVRSTDSHLMTFELANPLRAKANQSVAADLREEVRLLNLFSHLASGKLYYEIPMHEGLPLRLPQIMVLYTIMFWLGSVVRYDPHSVSYLRESRYWNIVESFINQSRVWLLELFQWELYQETTILLSGR